MNEQIEQLALQATDTIEIVNPDTGITHNREFFDKEKFAQLIVQECIANCDDLNSMKYIANHFGIKVEGLES
jgi:hypothetical protein